MRTSSLRLRGYSLIELMVVVAIIGIGMALAVPYFGGATAAARERSTVAKFQQDFDWGRIAAGVGDASTLGIAGVTGLPKVVMTLQSNPCTWILQVNGVTDPVHSMTTAAPNLTCAAGSAAQPTAAALTLPATFNFSSTGFVDNTGTFTFTGASGTTWPLQFLLSGSVIRAQGMS